MGGGGDARAPGALGSAGDRRRALGPEKIRGQRQIRPQGAGRTLDAGKAKVAEIHDPGNAPDPGEEAPELMVGALGAHRDRDLGHRVLVLARLGSEERDGQPGLQREVGDLAVQPRDFPLRRQPPLGQVEPLAQGLGLRPEGAEARLLDARFRHLGL